MVTDDGIQNTVQVSPNWSQVKHVSRGEICSQNTTIALVNHVCGIEHVL